MTAAHLASLALLGVVAVSAAAALYGRYRGRVLLGLGVRRPGMLREAGLGAAVGVLAMTATVGAVLACGGARLTGVGLDVPLLGAGLVYFFLAAAREELIFRVLLLTGLCQLTRRPAVALAASSVLFGLVHVVGNADATPVSALSNALGGVMYGLAFLRTGRVWMPLGLHLGWNLVQSTGAGFPISGITGYAGALARVEPTGPDWLSGGTYGPEGSVLSLLLRVVVIVAVLAITRSAPTRSTAKV